MSKARDRKTRKTCGGIAQSISSNSLVLVVALFIITFNLQTFAIPTGSMIPTLLVGDHLIVERATIGPEPSSMPLEYSHQIQRGDIIVFFSQEVPDMNLVKRVIALPGDRIHLRDGIVYLNGRPQTERYVIHSVGNYDPYRDNFPALPPSPANLQTPRTLPLLLATLKDRNGDDLVVPPGKYFVMGDNRDVSYDSRYWGFVPHESIIGRPFVITWSIRATEGQLRGSDLTGKARMWASVLLHPIDLLRWQRTLHLVQ
jgi:signal peptidase I